MPGRNTHWGSSGTPGGHWGNSWGKWAVVVWKDKDCSTHAGGASGVPGAVVEGIAVGIEGSIGSVAAVVVGVEAGGSLEETGIRPQSDHDYC